MLDVVLYAVRASCFI